MKKYFVISDIHGFYNEMIEALNKVGFDKENKEHILISLGDLFDRGKKNVECLNFVMSIPRDRRILIKGNHEELLEELLLNKRGIEDYDKHNGTLSTLEQFSGGKRNYGAIEETRKNILLQEYFLELVDYYANDKYIFCHGFVPFERKYREIVFNLNASKEEWRSARWMNGMYQWRINKYHQDCYGQELKDKRTIVCGHWHTSYGHAQFHRVGEEFPRKNTSWKKHCCFDIFMDDGIIALDACTALTHKVNVFVFEGD